MLAFLIHAITITKRLLDKSEDKLQVSQIINDDQKRFFKLYHLIYIDNINLNSVLNVINEV